MTVAHSKITSQGQISVPATIRRRLGLAPGAVLEWQDEGGKIVVRRAGRYSSEELHRAVFPNKAPKSRTAKELKAGVRKYVRARHARS